jgi:putative two-component system response regulator
MLPGILHHHERWDGGGYPRGLSEQNIPLSARIAAVADVYDALTTKRVYKDAMPHEAAVATLQEGAGSQFDPAVVEAFLAREREFAEVASEMSDQSAEDEPAEVLAAR